jgi:hypothetical protein
MALDGTYTGLQASVADFLNRADLTTQIPDFIRMAEARFNREIRHNAMLKRQATSATSDYVTLPTDWLEHVSIVVTGNTSVSDPLEYVPNEEFNRLRLKGLTGAFRYYTIQENNIVLLPAASSGTTALEIFYYAKIPALSGTNATNWLLTRSPDLYLYASLLAAEAFLQNDERLPLWASAMKDAMDSMKLESERAKRPQGALNARKRTFG